VLRPEVIRKRLQKLEEYLTILERIRRYSLEEFLAEPERPPRLRRGLRTVPVRLNHPHT